MNYKELTFIYWSKETKTENKQYVTRDDWFKLKKELDKSRHPIPFTGEVCALFNKPVYCMRYLKKYLYLYWLDDYNQPHIAYYNKYKEEESDSRDIRPRDAMNLLEDKFKELNDKRISDAFGSVPEEFKRNIPKGFYYVKPSVYAGNEYWLSTSYIDASSQYPSGLIGKLPDANEAIIEKGYVKPNEEYPFAFYSNGHMAIYNELDTRQWRGSRFAAVLFRQEGKDEWAIKSHDDDPHTTLMKASDYSMEDTIRFFFNGRKEHEDYKRVLNVSIGFMHKQRYTDRKFAHLAAVAIARGNQKILNMCQEIGYDNIIHICVDGIIYDGDKEYGIHDKQLGVFKQEYTDCMLRIKGQNQYIAMNKEGEVVTYKHCASQLYVSTGKPIDDQGVYSLKDMDDWTADTNKQFETDELARFIYKLNSKSKCNLKEIKETEERRHL